jgi:hypothetical protein
MNPENKSMIPLHPNIGNAQKPLIGSGRWSNITRGKNKNKNKNRCYTRNKNRCYTRNKNRCYTRNKNRCYTRNKSEYDGDIFDIEKTDDVLKIRILSKNNGNYRVYKIKKEIVELNKMSLHRKCGCNLPEIIQKVSGQDKIIFNTKKDRKVWYIIKKSIMNQIVNSNRCSDIFPCSTFDNPKQNKKNGFVWIHSKNLDVINALMKLSNEVYDTLRSNKSHKRDYHFPIYFKTIKYNRMDKNAMIEHNDDGTYVDTKWGFTSIGLTKIKSDEMMTIGIIQYPKGKWKTYDINAPGGKRDAFWDESLNKFVSEGLIESTLREVWEELGLKFSEEIFNHLKNSTYEMKQVKIFNLVINSLNDLSIKKENWGDPENMCYTIDFSESDKKIKNE